MKDNLEVGMYVRTKEGSIAKILGIDYEFPEENAGSIEAIFLDKTINDISKDIYLGCLYVFKECKASHNIMELIEAGDYVNGHRVACVMESLLGFEDGQDGDWYMENKDIKSILTHEQFDRMVYRIEE